MPEVHLAGAAAAMAIGAAIVVAAMNWSRTRSADFWRLLPTSAPSEFSRPAEAAAFYMAQAVAAQRAERGNKPVPPFSSAVVNAARESLEASSSSVAAQAIQLLQRAEKEAAALEAERARSFDEAQDLGMLKDVWSAAQLEGEFSRSSKEWSKLGFQGMDPTTDLRGGGVLALRHFLNLARFNDGGLLKQMVDFNGEQLAEGDMSWFLTAVVAIQFSTRMMLGELPLCAQHFEAILDDGAGVGRGIMRMHVGMMQYFFEVWLKLRPSVMDYTQFVEPNVIDPFFDANRHSAADS